MEIGKKTWVFSDGDLPPHGDSEPFGHEALMIVNNGEKEATLTFRQREFFFPEPAPAGEPTPASWLRRCAENNGRTLTFAYADAKSQPIKPWYKRPRDVIYA